MSAQLYTSAELLRALAAQFPATAINPVVMNNRYCAVTRDWVEKQFAGYIWNFEVARGQLTWTRRGNQCEHFALRAALEAVDLFRQMPEALVPAEAESLAVCAIKYLQHAGTAQAGWHEINLWYHTGVWCPWEPQQRRYLVLTEAERLTVQQPIIP